jgi:hypothetical protein
MTHLPKALRRAALSRALANQPDVIGAAAAKLGMSSAEKIKEAR